MNRNEKVRLIALNGMIAAVYAALTLALTPISYGAVQFRVSEALIFLAFFNRKYIPGLVIGCLIANLGSSLGMMDVVFGTFATLLAVIAMDKLSNRFLAAFAGALFNGIIVGIELTIVFNTPLLFNMGCVFIGELAVLLITAVVIGVLEDRAFFQRLRNA